MNLDIQLLDKSIEKHFNQLQQRVQSRLKSQNSLDWLLKPQNELPFLPDYLTMSSAGRTRFEQSLNKLLSRFLPTTWFRFFWPKITQGLISYTENKYYKKIFHQIDDSSFIIEIQHYISSTLKQILSRNWENLVNCTFTELSNCLLAVIHEPLKHLPIESDIFLPDKQLQNASCLELLKQIRHSLRNSENRFETLVYLSCRSNWIDSLEDDPEDLLMEFTNEIKTKWLKTGSLKNTPLDSVFYQVKTFKRLISSTSGPILFESDNCGELIFDLCLIEELISQNRTVYLCVKGCPVVNDAMEKDVMDVLEDDMFSDLKSARQQGSLRIISAGNFIGGGKIVYDVNDEYKKAYLDSDLVIIKGQGNFQSMPIAHPVFSGSVPYLYQKSAVFMTGIKADMIQMCLTALYPKNKRPPTNSILLHVVENK